MFVTIIDSLYQYNTGHCPLSDRGEPVPKTSCILSILYLRRRIMSSVILT